jgi:SpoVK/Ycf46/Vps4 family AAA+-type ATPase
VDDKNESMDVSTMVVDRDSSAKFSTAFFNLISAGAGIIQVRTREIGRAVADIRRLCVLDDAHYSEWDICNGLREFNKENYQDVAITGDGTMQVVTILQQVWDRYREYVGRLAQTVDASRSHIFALVNPQFQMENNPVALHRFIEFCKFLPTSTVRLVLITGPSPLPRVVADYATSIDYELPGHGELMYRLHTVVESLEDSSIFELSEQEQVRVCVAGAGMTSYEFELAVSRAIIETTTVQVTADEPLRVTFEDVVQRLQTTKMEVVKKNDLLDLVSSEDMGHVGGMDRLKDWVAQRSHCYSQEFKDFGGTPPKGVVVIGVPGSGKSLIAKAVGGVLGIPVVRLDFSKVFSSLVGSSEERMRTALAMVEAMAPICLFVDEIDKGLGGLGGSGDSGTSQRVFGSFLTWLNDNTSPVFTIVTANNIDGLPPELFRRGRFDGIFATTLPNEWEREDVLRIHLELRGHSIDKFTDNEVAQFRQVTDAYVPAEIEAIVKDAIVMAYAENRDRPRLEMRHLIRVAQEMVPLSKSHTVHIAAMIKWGQDNAMPASSPESEWARRRSRSRPTGADRGTVVRRLPTRNRRRPIETE